MAAGHSGRGFLHIAPKRFNSDSSCWNRLSAWGQFYQFPYDGLNDEGVYLLLELVAPVEVDVLPGDRGDLLDFVGTLRLPGSFLVLQEMGKNGSIVKDDAVGDQAAALRPEI